jgi:altronate hydrolase
MSQTGNIAPSINGYLRSDGRKGIRNLVVVVYLVECAHHVAREIVYPVRSQGVHLLGFPGCYPNSYAHRMLQQLCTHPNVGAVLLVSLGCEGFNRSGLLEEIRASGRPAELLIIQQSGGTRSTIESGAAWVAAALNQIQSTPRAAMNVDELIIGTICGGSDATSGITANPAVGRAFRSSRRVRRALHFRGDGRADRL